MLSTINGWLVLHKHKSITSAKFLNIAKKILNVKKAGHIGTLDPEAEGVLPIALGEATKTISYISNEIKGYEFTLKLGIETSTGDLEGDVIRKENFAIDQHSLESVLGNFIGNIIQRPPIYSAIKINGERAYRLARMGYNIALPEREISIYELNLISLDFLKQEAKFYVLCSKGTYVRTLGQDIAKKIGAFGCVIHINRTLSGKFSIKDALTLEKLENIVHNGLLNNHIEVVEYVLDDIPVITLDEHTYRQVKNGIGIKINNQINIEKLYKAMFRNHLVALGFLKDGIFKPKKVFNL